MAVELLGYVLVIVENALPPPAKDFLLKFQDASVQVVRSADKQQESL